MDEEARVVAEGYDRIAKKYAETAQRLSARDEKYLHLLLERLPKGRVLDLGCGPGGAITRNLEVRYEVVGVDFSAAALRLAQKALAGATFVRAEMTALPFRHETFDAVCSFLAIIHTPRRGHVQLLRDLHDLLRPRGLLLVVLGADEGEAFGEFMGVPMYWSHFDAATNLSLVEGAGFIVLASSVEGQRFEGTYEEHLYVLAEKRWMGSRPGEPPRGIMRRNDDGREADKAREEGHRGRSSEIARGDRHPSVNALGRPSHRAYRYPRRSSYG